MTTADVLALAERVADVATIDGETATVSHVELSEYADGSGRSMALVTMIDGEHEQTYRIVSPAPWNSPAWASVHRDWTIEVRVGTLVSGDWHWLELDREVTS